LELPPSSMGFMLPSSDSPAEKARALIARRTVLEAELDEQLSVLRSNGVDSRSPLVDADGFPRADIDVWAVRHARVRAIELRNDLVTLTNEIGAALTAVYDPALRSQSEGSSERKEEPDASAFAKVDGVLSGSPAAAAVRQHLSSNAVRTLMRGFVQGLQTGDLVLRFGHLTRSAMTSGLQPLAALVAENENVCGPIISSPSSIKSGCL
jgi:26S proteasome regulatory subunit N4